MKHLLRISDRFRFFFPLPCKYKINRRDSINSSLQAKVIKILIISIERVQFMRNAVSMVQKGIFPCKMSEDQCYS